MRTSIQRYRMSQNLTQDQLAKKMDVTRSAVAMWESGINLPRSDRLLKLAEILNCTINDLLKEGST